MIWHYEHKYNPFFLTHFKLYHLIIHIVNRYFVARNRLENRNRNQLLNRFIFKIDFCFNITYKSIPCAIKHLNQLRSEFN